MTTTIDLFTKPLTMRDGTERRALVARVAQIEEWQNHDAEEFAHDIWVQEALLIRAAHEWACKNAKGWQNMRLANFGHTADASLLVWACHEIADAQGVAP